MLRNSEAPWGVQGFSGQRERPGVGEGGCQVLEVTKRLQVGERGTGESPSHAEASSPTLELGCLANRHLHSFSVTRRNKIRPGQQPATLPEQGSLSESLG